MRGGYSGYRSRGYNPIRGRQPTRNTFQNLESNFQPKTEWKEEDAGLVLLVHLPGFLKEQVTITTNESTGYIRIYGERMLVINNIRSWFNTGYNIPKNCNLSQMKWEFSGGILTIRIPKIIPAVQRTSTRESDATTSQDVPKPEMKGEETSLRRTSTAGKDVEAIGPQKGASESVSQKGQDESPQKAKLLANTTKELDEKTAGVDGEKVGQNVIEKKEQNEAYGKSIEEEKGEKIEESKIAESVVLKNKEDEEKSETAENKNISKEIKDMENASASANKDVAMDKELEAEKKDRATDADKEKSNKDMENASASANKSEKDSDKVNDKNVLILNICVGVSVVMALGAHLYIIIFSSSRKT